MTQLTIGKAAQTAGVHIETIRFYERRGLIDQPPKAPGTAFRVYSPETIRRVRFIRQAQELGFSLREVKELLSLRASGSSDCGDVQARAQAKLVEVDSKIAHLERIRRALEDLIKACPGQGEIRACTILEALNPGKLRGPSNGQSQEHEQ
jgi:MerR family copper efflux transcriptional regulator